MELRVDMIRLVIGRRSVCDGWCRWKGSWAAKHWW